jgi:hypothetical protein
VLEGRCLGTLSGPMSASAWANPGAIGAPGQFKEVDGVIEDGKE